MGDPHDIDALLMGALYGELDAADQARLEAHLASHPGDRATMDALSETRTRVRDGLAPVPDVDPSPAISTVILQEAARRAPKRAREGERGFFAWLSGVFQPVGRHPALAGAMALALVAGTAGVLYEKGKVTSEERKATDTSVLASAGSAAPAPASGEGQTAQKNEPTTDSYQVKLDDKPAQQIARTDGDSGNGDDTLRGELAKSEDGKDVTRGAGHGAAPQKHGAPAGTPVAANARDRSKGKGYVEVTTLDRQPKQLDEQGGANGFASSIGGAGGGGGAGAGSGSAAGPASQNGLATGDAVAATPPPSPAPKAATAAPGGQAGAAYDPNAAAKLNEWAKLQHQHMLALVKQGDCVAAGKIGGDIAAKAPEYYAANIENDRNVRACKQYIDQDKRAKANEKYKSRARNNAYEPDLEAPAANQ